MAMRRHVDREMTRVETAKLRNRTSGMPSRMVWAAMNV
jgi:hypothetical protein